MCRTVTNLLLLVAGALLGLNIGYSQSTLSTIATGNSATEALTSLLYQNTPRQLFTLEQHALSYLPMTPYAFAMGLLGALIFGMSRVSPGVLFWSAFAVAWTISRGIESEELDGLSWHLMLPDAAGQWCTVPIYIVGTATGRVFREGTWPRFGLVDMLAATTIIAMICAASLAPAGWIPPLSFLLAFIFLAWRWSATPGRVVRGRHS